MTRKTLRNTVIAASATLVVAGGFALVAQAMPFGSGLFGHGGHAAHFHHAMSHLVDELELDAAQQVHLENIHQAVSSRHRSMAEEHMAHVSGLAERIERGELDGAEARAMVDRHLEGIHLTAYTVVDEMVALVNGLDDDQRAVLVEHLEEAKAHGEHFRGHAH